MRHCQGFLKNDDYQEESDRPISPSPHVTYGFPQKAGFPPVNQQAIAASANWRKSSLIDNQCHSSEALKSGIHVISASYKLADNLQTHPNYASHVGLFHTALLWQMRSRTVRREGYVIFLEWNDLSGMRSKGGRDQDKDKTGNGGGRRSGVS